MNEVANAIRQVTARVQRALDQGRRSQRIDAEDVVELLLAIADELDPPTADLVNIAFACPNCRERRKDRLVWDADEAVRCARCGTRYRPGA